MKEFFGEDYLLQGESTKKIYSAIKDLPIKPLPFGCGIGKVVVPS